MIDKTPESTDTKRTFRPFWTFIAIGVIFLAELFRYVGGLKSEENQHQPVRPQSPANVIRIELDENEPLPESGEGAKFMLEDRDGKKIFRRLREDEYLIPDQLGESGTRPVPGPAESE